MKIVTVQEMEHTDVRGKKLFYLKMSNGTEEMVINVGDKTFKGVRELREDKPEDTKKPAKKEDVKI